MSNYWYAYTLVKRGFVSIEKVIPGTVIVFNTKSLNNCDEREVVFDIKADYWLCLCEYASLWKGNKKNYCYHVRACQMLLNKLFKDQRIKEKWLGHG